MLAWYNIGKEGEQTPSKEKENKMYTATEKVNKVHTNIQNYMNRIASEVHDWCYDNDYGCWDPKLGSFYNKEIAKKLDLGWTTNEVYSLLIRTEEVNPRLEEGEAIRMMTNIEKSVNARIASVRAS